MRSYFGFSEITCVNKVIFVLYTTCENLFLLFKLYLIKTYDAVNILQSIWCKIRISDSTEKMALITFHQSTMLKELPKKKFKNKRPFCNMAAIIQLYFRGLLVYSMGRSDSVSVWQADYRVKVYNKLFNVFFFFVSRVLETFKSTLADKKMAEKWI